jgi:uncharacterized protein (TIGR01777 family)
MTPVFALLILQTLLGAFDNLWHHEITERLPAKRSAAGELALHCARELIYGCVFLQLAWLESHGAWVTLLVALLGLEIVITLADFVLEDRTRRLPPLERILHTILAINFGLFLAVLTPTLIQWWSLPTAITTANHGAYSWLLSVFASGTLLWSLRNAIAVLRLRRPPEWVRNPIATCSSPTGHTILISGATGFIGGHLVRRLLARGDRVIVLTRDPDRALDRFGPHVRIITKAAEIAEHERIDAVINLSGAPILGFPWTRARRRQLISSRVATTWSIIEVCGRLARSPRVFVSASAIGYYGLGGDEPLDEKSAPQAIFQSRLCQEWESSADVAAGLAHRIVKLRIGLVLGRDGGALPQLVRPMRWGLGAVLGSGQQWVSWIHIDDLIRMFELALDTPALSGPLNAVAPGAVRHRQMQTLMAKVLHRPLWIQIPAFIIRGALGEMSQLLVAGQRVIPARASNAGFRFKHPTLGEALTDLLQPDLAKMAAAHVYYNGECPVCRTEMEHYASLCATARPQVQFIDSTQQADGLASYGLRREHLERRVYLHDSRGAIISGMPAIIALWSQMPRYKWLAHVFNLPLLRPASVAVYDHVIAPTLARWATSRTRRSLKYGQARP